jgi:dynein heavy chain 2
LGPILEQWQLLTSSSPGVLNAKRAGKDVTGGGAKGKDEKASAPIDDFVVLENDLAGELVTAVEGTLSSLKKVLFGSGLLTPAIQAAAIALLGGMVPAEWTKRWDAGPEKPQAWLRELVRKRIALMKWRTSSARNTLLSEPLVLGDLFNPATFINALRQQTARQLNAAIDTVKMVCSWEKDSKVLKSGGCPLICTLSSLLLQGATFHNMLQDSASEAAELTPAPNVAIGFVPLRSPDSYQSGQCIGVPVFLSTTREEYLTEIHMPCNSGDQDKWVLSGVALFLSEAD